MFTKLYRGLPAAQARTRSSQVRGRLKRVLEVNHKRLERSGSGEGILTTARYYELDPDPRAVNTSPGPVHIFAVLSQRVKYVDPGLLS